MGFSERLVGRAEKEKEEGVRDENVRCLSEKAETKEDRGAVKRFKTLVWVELMRDIRTPSFYFQDRNDKREKLNQINLHLDNILEGLQSLKSKSGATPAYKKIVKNEIKRVEKKKVDKRKFDASTDIVDRIIDNDFDDVVTMIKDELDLRAYTQMTPEIKSTASEIQNQVFGSD